MPANSRWDLIRRLRVNPKHGGCKFLSVCMASRFKKEAILLPKVFPFTLEVLDKDFNIIHYILIYTFDFYQVSAYVTPISCEFQISVLRKITILMSCK